MTEPATQSQANVGPETSANRRRGGRACDTCRRAKVRCEPLPNSTTCQACHTAGIECLYTGPNFKRGPPKGYIQALEQRWYRCETLLAAITTSRNPYALAIVQLLHQDELAREVLDSVNNGPFGPAGRAALSASATLDEVFHYLTTNSVPTAGSSSRPEKRSRVSREAVSNETATMSFKELGWWEDRLSTILASAELQNASEYAPESSSQQQGSHAGDPDISGSLDMSQLYSMFPASEEGTSDSEVDEAVDAFGHLSVDETQELRYHGNVSGYPLLSGEDRWDDRNEGGVWKFPMARVWPSAVEGRHNYPQEEDIDIQMPPREQQEPLIKTYFTYIHPCFPLIDKPQFIKQFKAGFEGECTQGPRTKTLSKVLLLSVLAIAERYATSKENTPPEGVMSELGCDFAATAHEIVAKTMHHSHPVICQSLLIMGVREFSLGSTEQAWLYTGMAIRMAYDLGLNWDPANWKFKGEDLFSNKDKQIRRTIWWSLCIVDRHLSAFLGRPPSIHGSDFEVLLPNLDGWDQGDDVEDMWQPTQDDPAAATFAPVAGEFIHCFICSSTLATIMGEIIMIMYPVTIRPGPPSPEWQTLENHLHQWYFGLPSGLQYSSAAALVAAPPHVMALHVNYWYAVLILHRALYVF